MAVAQLARLTKSSSESLLGVSLKKFPGVLGRFTSFPSGLLGDTDSTLVRGAVPSFAVLQPAFGANRARPILRVFFATLEDSVEKLFLKVQLKIIN